MNIQDWKQHLVKFGIVGLMNTAIDYGLFNILLSVSGVRESFEVGLINMFTVSLAAANSFFLNRNWTFRSIDSPRLPQAGRFLLTTGAGIIINSLVVAAASNLASLLPIPGLIVINLGKLLGAAFSVIWNFLTYRHWVFTVPKEPPATPDRNWQQGLVSIIIPAYNEEKRLPSRLAQLAETLPHQFPVEIVVVNDGSTDETLEVARQAANRHPFIRCITHTKNQGKGKAVQTGMQSACGEYLVFADADETFTGKHIYEIVLNLKDGKTVVIGNRRAASSGKLDGESTARIVMGKVFNWLAQTLLLPGITDTQCGLKGFRRKAADAIFSRQKLRGFAFDLEVLALARALNYEIAEIPVSGMACQGSRVNRWLSPLQMFLEMIRLKLALLTNSYRLSPGENRVAGAALAVGLFSAALAVRLPWLWLVPRYIDELKEVNLGYLIYLGQAWPLHNMAHDIGAMHNYILAGLFRILGPSIYWPRLYVAITSALTVVLIYYLGRRMYNHWVGLAAAGLLLTNGLHIMVTHMAWSNSTTPFFFSLALLATLLAEEQKSGPWLVAAGLLWAMTLQTHSSAIIYVLVATIYICRPYFRQNTGISSHWYLASALALVAGYTNMIYFNIVTSGGSIRWLVHKPYALESNPGIISYLHNLVQMVVELLKTLSSTYLEFHILWHYLLQPQFIVAAILLCTGSYYAFKRNYSLPVWMIVGAFAVIPWINQRYTFYLATRYIMPVVLCAILLVGLGAVELFFSLSRKVKYQTALYPSVAIIFSILIILQFAPYYNYCSKMVKTNGSNYLALGIMSNIEVLALSRSPLVLVDQNLPLENRPIPYLLALNRHQYMMLPSDIHQIKDIIQSNNSHSVIAVVSHNSYKKLHKIVTTSKVKRLACQVPSAHGHGKRVVYVIKLSGK